MKAALYARVSTQSQNVDMQLTELRQAALQRGWTTLEYVDQGESGKKTSRPALDRMLKDARAGKFQVLVLWKLDRLGRTASHVLWLLEQLQELGITFIALRDAWADTTTPAGKLLTTMIVGFAEMERSLIRERSLAGIAQAQAKGIHCGRPRKDLTNDQIATARLMFNTGWGARRIAQTLGCTRSTLQRQVAQKPPPSEAP